jgi:hypothetical protein
VTGELVEVTMAGAGPTGRSEVDITVAAVSASERVGLVDLLDLEPIVFKLIYPESGEAAPGLARADRDVWLYRCFLKLCLLHPGASIVPTRAIDRVWHLHVLDTAKYLADCELVFGRFVDHFPYAGLGGEADRLAWRQDFEQTRRLFQVHFGVEIGREAAASACRNHGDGSDCCVEGVPPAVGSVRPRPVRG